MPYRPASFPPTLDDPSTDPYLSPATHRQRHTSIARPDGSTIRRLDGREDRGEDYRGWPLRQRLELLAFDARLAGVPQALLKALWEAMDRSEELKPEMGHSYPPASH
jgi:hypothetical protein